jgi:hypothetical protein
MQMPTLKMIVPTSLYGSFRLARSHISSLLDSQWQYYGYKLPKYVIIITTFSDGKIPEIYINIQPTIMA